MNNIHQRRQQQTPPEGVAQVDKTAEDTYRYLNFDQLAQYTEKADGVISQTAV